MDIREEYKSLIVKIENKEELIEIQSFINSIKNAVNDLTNTITVFPNYFLYRMDINKFNFLTNSLADNNEIFQLEILKRHVIDNYTFKGYPVIFNLSENNLNRIKNIIIFGKDYAKPDYSPKKITKFESFLNEEIEPMMIPDWEKLEFSKEDEEKLKLQYVKKLGKSGELLDYVKKGKTKLTFGILRSLFNDAIAYKKRREMTKGFYKFVHRIVPIALAAFWFPVWVLAQVLGGSRALNKVLIPVLKMNPSNYKSFLVTLITKTMDLMEGEIKTFMGDDWYYRVFMVDWGIIKMIRKEHIYNFALHVATVMENEPDEKIVPTYYIENEMRKWLNDKFNINPPIPLKTEEIINESVDYSYIKKFLD